MRDARTYRASDFTDCQADRSTMRDNKWISPTF